MGAAVIVDTALLVDMNIVPIDGPNADTLIKKYPFFAKQVIPAKTYKGNEADINTVAVMAILAARADLEEDVVYDILKAMMEDYKEIHRAHERYKSFTPETALVGMSIPLHKGAEKYYKEKGLLK
jgi:TRAP transporter TAXI family solute receptor